MGRSGAHVFERLSSADGFQRCRHTDVIGGIGGASVFSFDRRRYPGV
jgi:hypothetical protein